MLWRRKMPPSFSAFIGIIVAVILAMDLALCQNVDDSGGVDTGKIDNPAVRELMTQEVNRRLANVTSLVFSSELAEKSSFCILDKEKDWNNAFNFSQDLRFLSDCVARTRGDVQQRLCTAAEIRFYFSNMFMNSMSYLNPNRNCNLTSWISGCEPGWACSTGSNQNPDLRNLKDIPTRTTDCQPCCEGFFCPHGITCMIPCPLGSYCPLARLNNNTGVCEPYNYQLPHRQSNHTCGGANIWADVTSSSEIFCSAGSYCPSNTERIRCSSGNYCPTGSTAEKRCFKLTSCDPNTSSQNMHAYGVMLIVALSTVLLIIYNCSDQIITIRERRRARSRESAAKSVKERVQAQARWKSAKDAVKKHAIELHSQVSLKLSRNKAVTVLNETENDQDGDMHASNSMMSMQSAASSDGTESEPSPYMKMMKDIGFDNSESFDSEIKDKNLKTRVPKGKQAHTHSQMFKYAYAQLEKEKAQQQQNKSLTFSGVISMATNKEIRKRPTIEIAFRDLTVTLKGKNKHLLRSINGKVMPGRVTAVMGPSGAGKTTFLSALAGKTVGCTLTGSIFINGKTESIHSYRKILGFVPQDDIVHGNLTVEENLWFSAKCRLSADLPKPDKVLIVERVIDSLGLQAVRNSLVGTVEKRGISGGQRKRVNVGLELVIEPSLLFLDEPTSGLDSASSQLLLRALRREALEGVNICMVVHQPSYTLFKMFDDLILLAKGGLTVYHGPAKKVEEYFAGLGINVPERVNPPDYFIDVLEGLIRPNASSNMSYNELPVSWMVHNGYAVPPDMRQNCHKDAVLPTRVNINNHILSGDINLEHSFAGEIWQDMKCNVERHRDILHHNFLRSKDLSNRRTPSILLQYKYFLGRVGKQRLREAKTQAMDYLILLVAGACLGSLTKVKDETFGSPGYVHTIIAVSLLCKVAALRTFSLDKLQYWRESASGISSLAHFVSKDTIDHFNTLIKPAVYLSMFYFFCNPRSSFADNYIILLCLVYCVTGMGYALAIFLDSGPAQLCAVLVPVVLTLVATRPLGSKFFNTIADLCYPKWALQGFVIANAERYYGVWLITRCGALRRFGYDIHNWGLCSINHYSTEKPSWILVPRKGDLIMDPDNGLDSDPWTKSSLSCNDFLENVPPDDQPFNVFTLQQQKWESSFLNQLNQPSQNQSSVSTINNIQIRVPDQQDTQACDSNKIQEWDPKTMLNNLSFLEKKIHELQDLVHVIVGRRGQVGFQANELLVQQQQLITADLTSIIVQLISTAGSLLPTVKHTLSYAGQAAQLVQSGGVAMPSGAGFNSSALPQSVNVSKVEDHSIHIDPVGDSGMDQNCTVEEHELKDEDEAEEEENLPPGSYEILQLEKEEILAPHTHFCTICGKGFKRDANLRMHMRGHGDEYKTPAALAKPHKEVSSVPALIKRYSCPYVGCKRNREHKKFQPLKTILCVKNHYKRTHCEKSYTCSRCNIKKFSVIADLKTHEKHCGKDKWLCSCGTTFSRKDKLFGHIALFQGHTPAIPLDDHKGSSSGLSDQGQNTAGQIDPKLNNAYSGSGSGSPQNAIDVKGSVNDPGNYFSPMNYDTGDLGGFQDFPRVPFEDSNSSFSFLLSGSCDYPQKAGKYGSSSE